MLLSIIPRLVLVLFFSSDHGCRAQGIVHLVKSYDRCYRCNRFSSRAGYPPSPYISAFSVASTETSHSPRPLTEAEIQGVVATYAKAASNVVDGVGFDGVKIHNTNGYLPDPLLQRTHGQMGRG
ncbi:hypothetical protein JVT61DRAFT_4051 [Boletus reticuloceps]|uniref:NADH:flavin oxidoreductase/NADH oxidase N-terminal domain-containing protein n=1 Tax=Boletus reticuloceps TaxID=495285 RepID=A0A8I2YMV2_9AGAM|nr:hypothetical protein JVT61DRAFT_4051 [Boletus reticuloceps]